MKWPLCLWENWHPSPGDKCCLPLSSCWREQCIAKTLRLSQNVSALSSLMAVLNDFALNGGIVPSHSRTGRPRTLCGRISSNEQFNHYINSSRTDNLKKKKKTNLLNEGVHYHISVLQDKHWTQREMKKRSRVFTFSVEAVVSQRRKIKNVPCWQKHRVTAGVRGDWLCTWHRTLWGQCPPGTAAAQTRWVRLHMAAIETTADYTSLHSVSVASPGCHVAKVGYRLWTGRPLQTM